MLGHTASEWITDIQASCEQTGSRHKECTVCETILETETISALGHTASEWVVDIQASCEQTGSRHKECTVCGAILETEIISALGHTESDWVVDIQASCENNGTKHKNCTVCEDILTTEIIPALDHDFVKSETVAPDWSEKQDGYDLYVCSHDSNHVEKRNIVSWDTLSAVVTVKNGSVGGKSYVIVEKGTTITLVADEIKGKTFDKWTVNGVEIGISTTLKYEVNGSVQIVAEYKDVPKTGCAQSAMDVMALVFGLVGVAFIFKKSIVK